MRYLMMIKSDESKPAGPPPPDLLAAIADLGQQAAKDGTLLDQAGLLPSSAGALIRVSGGKIQVSDGPFTEAKELVGGYALFQLRSYEDAVEAGRAFMAAHARHWPGFEGVCEIRAVAEPGAMGDSAG